MKNFYVLNLDFRRIAIVVGALLVVLGVTLFLGLSIGRGQGERAAIRLADEAQSQKMGLTDSVFNAPQKTVLAAGPDTALTAPIAEPQPNFPASGSSSETHIPLQEDPLVQGPPKKSSQKKQGSKKNIAHAKPTQSKEKRKKGKEDDGVVVSGKINHASKNGAYTIQVAAFKKNNEAQGLIRKLREEGIRAHSEKSGSYYLVTVGHSRSKTKLSRALSRLKELEYKAYIRKVSKVTEET